MVSHAVMQNGWYRFVPLLAFLAVYTITCLTGAIFFLLDVEAFVLLYEYFSGAAVPVLGGYERFVAVCLLVAAPCFMAAGYTFTTSHLVCRIFPSAGTEVQPGKYMQTGVALLFLVSASITVWSLLKSGAFNELAAWTDYAAYVGARWKLFRELGYFEFVNIYLALPFIAAWLALIVPFRGRARFAAVLVIGLVVVLLTFFLFQKKSIIVSVIIFGGALLLDASALFGREWVKRAGLGIVILTIAYFLAVVVPVMSDGSRTAEQSSEVAGGDFGVQSAAPTGTSQPEVKGEMSGEASQDSEARIGKPGTLTEEEIQHRRNYIADRMALHESRAKQIWLYTLMAPLTRTSASALFYPVVFPDEHPYYGIDLGQDILGFGHMPDDTIVVWRFMNPNISGSASAPYQFVLYSQIGLIGALAGSLVVGAALGFAWAWSQISFGREIRALAGCGVVLFAIYIAIDGVRNSIFSSYGMLWYLLMILAIWAVSNIGRLSFSR